MNAKHRVAITGSQGYLGSILTERLQSAGLELYPMGRSAPLSFDLDQPIAPGFFSSRQIDTLVHCAYDFRPRRASSVFKTNVEGSIRLLSEASRQGVGNIILISSMSAFDGCQSVYGKAKLAIEREAAKLGAKIVRSGLIYGSAPGGMVGTLIRLAKISPVLPIIGNGKQPLYAIHEDDLSSLVLELIERPEIPLPAPLVAANPEVFSFREILSIFAGRIRAHTFFVPVPWRLIWMMLRILEILPFQTGLRSDSVVSLVNQNENPDFSEQKLLRTRLRGMEIA